ncbi:TatD family hydrolase [Weeksella sp. HMSC059D05]|uniref:TatD family hydrolase n=1 Tax=Weeksella sp. HMSC059D05 TaxID=1715139 RepID=UPI0008A39DA2|nr:TatD family hydrolase [Weeksella sp. HMSC059D05]OFM85349.1 hydrolase TatD [Weeksella sp. HMSC059D05]
MLIDTHTHLYSEQFDEDRNEMIQRALAVGVEQFYMPAIDSSYTEAMLQLERQYPENIHAMIGLHPTSVSAENVEEELTHVKHWLTKRTFKAVGEIGIDLYWEKENLVIQQKAFKEQIQLAKQYHLPIVIHCREAFEEVFDVLEDEKEDTLFGVFHCFTGTIEDAKRALDYNMHLGIGGVVTFKNGKIDQFLHEIPLEKIVLETDSPYLAPTPYRGKRNESSYLTRVVEKLVDIYRKTPAEIAEQTTANALSIFERS